MKQIRGILAALIMAFAATAFAGSEPGYTLLSPPQPTDSGDKIEVLEFFFYGCIHCYHLHPKLNQWEKTMPKDVRLTFVPVSFNPSWEPMAYTFYALQEMGKLRDLDDKLYDAWNRDSKVLVEERDIADFVASQGVNRDQFLSHFKRSSLVQANVKKAKRMIGEYQIGGTPTLVVDGKYVITGLTPDDAIRALNEAIAKAREEHGKR